MKLLHQKPDSGILLRDKSAPALLWQQPQQGQSGVKLQWAFVGLYIFTILLYARPGDWIPGFASISMIKIITIFTVLCYLGAKIARDEQLSIWPIELKMLLLILALGILFIPIAQSKEASLDALADPFIQVIIIFTLLVNVIDSREKLLALLKLIVICGTVISIGAIRSLLIGQLFKGRIEGIVGGMFQNANDLATAINILVPLALALAMTSKGMIRVMYYTCAAMMAAGVFATFSRGGFLGFGALITVVFWKLRLRHRVLPVAAALLVILMLLLIIPGGPGSKLSQKMMEHKDKTESVDDRVEVLTRGINVVSAHPVIGVGMGNFYLYSRHDLKAHNSYLEILAELGVIGFAAYITLLIAPLRSLKKLELETCKADEPEVIERFYLSLGLHASIASYVVCSAFSSIQYHWFVYYPMAFAIALRGIHANSTNNSAEQVETLFSDFKVKPRQVRLPGILWGHTTFPGQNTNATPERLLKSKRIEF